MDESKSTNGYNETGSTEKTVETSKQFDSKAIWLLTLGHLTTDTYGGFIMPLMPFIAANLGLSKTIVALIFTFQSISSSLLQPLYGYVADKASRRHFVILGLLLSTILISSVGLINNAWVLAFTLFFGSMGIGLFHPQAMTMVGLFSGKEINKAMGIFTAFGTIGYATGPFLSSYLTQYFGLQSTIYTAIFGIVIAALMYKYLPKIPARVKTASFQGVLQNLGSVKKILIILLVISVVKAIQILSFTLFMPFLWKQLGYNIAKIGTLVGLFSLFGGIANYLSGRIANKIGRKTTLAVSIIPSIPCLLGTLFLVKTAPIISFILFAISGFIIMLPTSIIIVIAQKAAPRNTGITAGILNGFSWGVVGLMFTPIGYLIDKFGVTPVLAVIAFTPLIAAICTAMIPKEYE